MPQEEKIEATVNTAVIEAIISGDHADPFAVLGPHEVDGGLAIRAFFPQAHKTAVLIQDQSHPLTRHHWDGFFEIVLPDIASSTPYQLQIITHAGESLLYEDPYAFDSALSELDLYLLAEGSHEKIYEQLGAHMMEHNGRSGVRFTVWAPNARRVSVVGEFNNWDGRRHPMRFHADSGIWEIFIPNLPQKSQYKYEIKTDYKEYTVAKADPVGFASQMRPDTASIVWDINTYAWQDNAWMDDQAKHNALHGPISIYELHLSSWKLKNGWEWLTYRDLIDVLIPYIKEMGYTHIELLPVSEHPFDGSWGYQVTGYFAPTSRFGTPNDFMAFVDACHQAKIGVILDWVPAHFPMDQHGLGFFDGTHLYEHEDPRLGAHPDWGTYIFNYGRNEVRQFLISNALFWLDKYHIDGLRVDAVASMLYLDFSRKPGEWLPNRYGGRENIDALQFLRNFNECVHKLFPNTLTIAEESTSWPGVTHSTADNPNNLGFDLKWNMGWMHDSLRYIQTDPVYRAFHQGTLTFSMLYAFDEKFVLPFSHDEVVHLKKNMLDKMPGDTWQKFANLRLLYGYQWAHPGKKLQFMGGEIGQWQEWSEARSLDWHLLQDENHENLQKFVKALNQLYRAEAALYEDDNSWQGFQWLDFRDSQRSILSFSRMAPDKKEIVMVACNFTPVVRPDYRLGVPEAGVYAEILNSDTAVFGGSNVINEGEFKAESIPWHEQPYSIIITLPPLGVTFFKIAAN
ncbi:MAG: 1,4-alpha-glucan branching protein GlgB [Chloroflexi bacterium]|nr:1,4-alpha-glucan branching protein GlgB [Chloroflexota bacterium]